MSIVNGQMLSMEEGQPFPLFTKQAWSGEEIRFGDLRGMVVVLYFYPEDDTPGCTAEAVEFTGLYDQFTDVNTEVIGVSVDSAESHEAFCKKHDIAIPLVSDVNGKLANEVGALDSNGRARRTTFVIDRAGDIAKIYENVDPKGHAEEVLGFVKTL